MSDAAAAIEFDRVSFSYGAGASPALEDVTLRVEPGERLGVLGPNGGGKTTLLRILMGLERGYSGRVRVFGRPPAAARREGLIGAVLQHCQMERAFPISVRQAVRLAAAGRGLSLARVAPATRERVDRSLELVGAGDIADRPIGALSGGQLQRTLIARAIAAEPRILALDEPTVGVDVQGQALFAAMLERLHEELDLTIVIVSHDVRAVAAGCDRVACLARRLHFHDAPEGLTPQVLAEVFQHDVAGIFGDVHVEAHAAEECPGDHAHTSGDAGASGAHD